MIGFDGAALKALVVEDNPNFSLLIRSVLLAIGVRSIEEATDGAAALNGMKTVTPDLVIVDWRMVPMNGVDFAKQVRVGPDSPNPFVPIIMVSGYTEPSLVAAARDVGVNEFMAKPISARILTARIESVFLRPRPFVRAHSYFGPDRRRKRVPRAGEERRLQQEPVIYPGIFPMNTRP
ncbi:MAG: response regulator [Alphaproteobacteria bacterium]|nr:response regulator [Alphaproteobacteria bacterium]